MTLPSSENQPVFTQGQHAIESARPHVAQTANATLTLLYGHIGLRSLHERFTPADARVRAIVRRV